MKGLLFSGGLSQTLGLYEPHLQHFLLKNLRTGSIFYDVGAHIGFFSLFASKMVGEQGCVYAFEPFLPNREKIEKAIAENEAWNIELCSSAVCETRGTRQLVFGSSTSTPSLIPGTGDRAMQVDTTTLDEFVKENHEPTLVKIDVEGAELLVLEGGQGLLSGDLAPTLIIEVHSAENDILVKGKLRGLGYHISDLQHPWKRRGRYPKHIVAQKQTVRSY
jgi:FkbM family methyltransferase